MAMLGVGAQVGVLLPFGRIHESEADAIGQDLMASAGFNPQASIELWQLMSSQEGDKPPELLSTHPADKTRIKNLEQRLPYAQQFYKEAKAKSLAPNCKRPPDNLINDK